ncbi:transport protein Sec24-like protein [Tanacetum coccineum]
MFVDMNTEDLAVQTGRIEFNIFDVSEFDNFDRNVVLLIHLSFDVVLLSVVHRAGDYHRAVHMWIFAESTQQLLLQKRVDCEDSWPEFWDISSAGHVSAGDTSLITARIMVAPSSGSNSLKEYLKRYETNADEEKKKKKKKKTKTKIDMNGVLLVDEDHVWQKPVQVEEEDDKMFHLWLQDTDGSVIPPPVPLSSEHVSDDGIYLLENGEDCFIYVGGSVDPDITQKLFSVSSFSEIPSQLVLQQYGNPLLKKLNEDVNAEAEAYHSLPAIKKKRLKLEALDKIQKTFDTHVGVWWTVNIPACLAIAA